MAMSELKKYHTICQHCKWRKVQRPRGLCEPCYASTDIRMKYSNPGAPRLLAERRFVQDFSAEVVAHERLIYFIINRQFDLFHKRSPLRDDAVNVARLAVANALRDWKPESKLGKFSSYVCKFIRNTLINFANKLRCEVKQKELAKLRGLILQRSRPLSPLDELIAREELQSMKLAERSIAEDVAEMRL